MIKYEEPPKYKILTTTLLRGCKTPAMLKKMIDLLPETTKPLEKRPKDIAFSVDYLNGFETVKEMDEVIREVFDKVPALKDKAKLDSFLKKMFAPVDLTTMQMGFLVPEGCTVTEKKQDNG